MSIATDIKGWEIRSREIAAWQQSRLINNPSKLVEWTGNNWQAVECNVAEHAAINAKTLRQTVFYAHSTDGSSKWVCLDFDNHDEHPDIAARNLRTAIAIQNTLTELGVGCGLEDSDGQGGLHLWILFQPPVPVAIAYRFARWISSLYPDDPKNGFEIERNPKQKNAESLGNGVRAPGRHHKRHHVSRFYGDGEWLSCHDAIDLMLLLPQNDPSVTDLMGRYDPDQKPQPVASISRLRRPRASYSGSGITARAEAAFELVPWPDLLKQYGWHSLDGRSWTRPGKSSGVSAVLNHNGSGLFHVFSSATNLPADGGKGSGQSYGKWRFHCHESGFGDHQHEAAKQFMEGATA